MGYRSSKEMMDRGNFLQRASMDIGILGETKEFRTSKEANVRKLRNS